MALGSVLRHVENEERVTATTLFVHPGRGHRPIVVALNDDLLHLTLLLHHHLTGIPHINALVSVLLDL